jgi:hypothetical protein
LKRDIEKDKEKPMGGPILTTENEDARTAGERNSAAGEWTSYAAGGALVAAGLLLLSGQRRAGMVAAASGTALALLGQQETLRVWWKALPGYLDDAERLLNQAQGAVEAVESQRETLRRILGGKRYA